MGADGTKIEYDQQFSQLRHYDTQIVGVAKFCLTAVFTIIATVIGVFKYHEAKFEEAHQKHKDRYGDQWEEGRENVVMLGEAMARDLFLLGILGAAVAFMALMLVLAYKFQHDRIQMTIENMKDHLDFPILVTSNAKMNPLKAIARNGHSAIALLFASVSIAFIGFGVHHMSYRFVRTYDMRLSWWNAIIGMLSSLATAIVLVILGRGGGLIGTKAAT